ncbi:Cation/calcium exchanger 1 [Acorus calamus]|uniref:Cation/calcium exchanger 1 n=1 Tax=Acorus calamus TaxID=4465 RepID=A0AAV9ED87_ACOCL|nr:Cation/calcium exchanger 1 [Acorus calamus]
MTNKTFLLFLNTSFLLLLLSFSITIHHHPSNLKILHHHHNQPPNVSTTTTDSCTNLPMYPDYKSKCSYVESEPQCASGGFIDYLSLFYCTSGRYPVFGYTLLVLWLIILFYLLANTAANYFCSSLESLSILLKLSPTLAGVTLLSLGNGAPDVFSSLASFTGEGTGDVGLNSILGGAFVVSSGVAGIICIIVSPREVYIEKSSFLRDVCSLLFALSMLLVILIVGWINVWGAFAFASMYLLYVFVVSASHLCRNRGSDGGLEAPMLAGEDVEIDIIKGGIEFNGDASVTKTRWYRLVKLLELPLYLPRRLTIPVVSEEGWSKPYGVASMILSPILLAFLWSSERQGKLEINIICGLVGVILGMVAYVTTDEANPPKRFISVWLIIGFLMSVVWTYIIAEELVGLLVSMGRILSISPSVLGLTVLAWGNSIGDLVADVALASKDGSHGAQVAISGCYAGPTFNVLVGLGLSIVFSSWASHPTPFVLPVDRSIFVTVGFLAAGLLWAAVILPMRAMRLDRVVGSGLLAIYLCFLSLRLAQTLGLVEA